MTAWKLVPVDLTEEMHHAAWIATDGVMLQSDFDLAWPAACAAAPEPDEQLIERMARAIGEHMFGWVDPDDTPHTWGHALGAAHVALRAMSEVGDD